MNLSAAACIRFGWETFKKRAWFFVGTTALMMVLSWVVGAIGGFFANEGDVALLGVVVNVALSTLLSMGFAAVMLRAHESLERVEIGNLWHPRPFWKFLGAELLTGLVVLVGFILLIVPGIIAILMLLFVPYIVIDKKLNPIEALKESARITRGAKWELLLLVLFIFGLNILGALLLLVGLLVSVPVTTLALVHAYRTLEAKGRSA